MHCLHACLHTGLLIALRAALLPIAITGQALVPGQALVATAHVTHVKLVGLLLT
jgi:hypothetical protein